MRVRLTSVIASASEAIQTLYQQPFKVTYPLLGLSSRVKCPG